MQSSLRRLAAGCLAASFAIVAFVAVSPAQASDHADPVTLVTKETNLTDLFFFPKDGGYVLIFDVRRNLTDPPPYKTAGDTFHVNFDLHSRVTFDNAADKARYGGTIVQPSGVSPDVTISVKLNPDGSLLDSQISGLTGVENIRTWSGVRDDPFIFPPFFKKNVLATVMTIPASSFPTGQQDFILWATTERNGEQVDHVGRSIRTQLPRYSPLPGFGEPNVNLLTPGQQVKAIMELTDGRNKITTFINKYTQTVAALPVWQTTFQMKPFDLTIPDVMIFTTRFPAGYPNGRLLTDDVVLETCLVGDCLLVDLSTMTGAWPRATKNDKAFLPDFPYLAEPWPSSPEPPPTTKSIIPLVLLLASVLFLVLTVIPFWIGYKWGWRRGRGQAAA
jgi:hypothetical protein